jgi:UDP-N-acetylmuramoylalanine--D-glutamate ligase
LKRDVTDFKNLRVTIMGLGLHGGGVASARFFASRGADVIVTDLKDETALKTSIEQLDDCSVKIELVLGRHRNQDFLDADLVLKNPAVPWSSPFLELCRSKGIPVETDISVFLSLVSNPIIAVTGSKGKSTVASAIHRGLQVIWPKAKLGGNITVSPLTFIDEIEADEPIVLELSSWQLADLREKGDLKPSVSLITNILPDHMNRYRNMAEYIEDKKIIFRNQEKECFAIFNRDDPHQKDFPNMTKARVYTFSCRHLPKGKEGAFLTGEGGIVRRAGLEDNILPEALKVLGKHNRVNLLAAGLALHLFGLQSSIIRDSLAGFEGIEHRLEFFAEYGHIRFFNDSTATIPHATVEALKSVPKPVILIAGGTDKNLDFSPLLEIIDIPEHIFLLQGSGTEKIIQLFEKEGRTYEGPFGTMGQAVARAIRKAKSGYSVLLSPACTSLEMFQNEFDRGRRYKELVHSLLGEKKK